MKCLVINLHRSPDRLAHLSAEFARIGTAFQRVAAIGARSHPELGQQPQHPMYAPRRLLGSEIACLHSHRLLGDLARRTSSLATDCQACSPESGTPQGTANGLVAKCRKPIAERITVEGGRTLQWIVEFCRGRRHIIVPAPKLA
ncbi:glycosyltransferase family 25 protein [Mesorhizobium sp. B2-3-13]|uniref:glycosyltransferase family 25 protein n=1 Tax=Mesorhizobium sp. B2-3-13 TaxID=2589951 RepID=UPI001FEFEBC7|nr:glycosyltransferase family 25 protein [Mesorhizobium sp. B2-3-13]